MRQHVAFLHTSPVHVETFDRLVKAEDPTVQAEHIVAEDLLADAQRIGAEHPTLVERIQAAMAGAASNGATIVVCTCSTIGGPAERAPTCTGVTAARIDRAMANRAVELGPRILIVAALESTLGPTAELIRESAIALRAEVELEHLLVSEAWPHFLRGDYAAYLNAVVTAVRAEPIRANVVVLAQASMAPAAETLNDLGVEVLASPTLGVQSALAHLRNDG
jgi:hypothetical protein